MINTTSDTRKPLADTTDTIRRKARAKLVPTLALPPGPALGLMLLVSVGLWVGIVFGVRLLWHLLATLI